MPISRWFLPTLILAVSLPGYAQYRDNQTFSRGERSYPGSARNYEEENLRREKTSAWNYVNERWPEHTGPLTNPKFNEAYMKRLFSVESAPVAEWEGQNGIVAVDGVTTCGVKVTGYLRVRPKGHYLLLFLESADGLPHKLQWIPFEFRFDNNDPREFHKRRGSPQGHETRELGPEQQDYRAVNDRPWDIREEPDQFGAHRSDYSKEGMHVRRENQLPRHAGLVNVTPQYKYFDAVQFPADIDFQDGEVLQIYLPWIEEIGCTDKAKLVFFHSKQKQASWDYFMKRWFTLGVQWEVAPQTSGWTSVRPNPSIPLRFVNVPWNHHGFSAEAHWAFVRGVQPNGPVSSFLGKLSYAYRVDVAKYFTFVPEAGVRWLAGMQGTSVAGYGAALDFVFEVPGTRHQKLGQRMIFELGYDITYYANRVYLNGAELQGAWGSLRLGVGMGW